MGRGCRAPAKTTVGNGNGLRSAVVACSSGNFRAHYTAAEFVVLPAEHEAFDRSDIDNARVAGILRDAGFRGWVSLEFEGKEASDGNDEHVLVSTSKTLAHETTHWTAHELRLARDFGTTRSGPKATLSKNS